MELKQILLFIIFGFILLSCGRTSETLMSEPFVVELAQELRKHQKMITAAIAVYYKDQLTDRALAQYDLATFG